MALEAPLVYNVSATFVDKENKPASVSWYYGSDELLLDVDVDAREVAAAIAALSNAALKRITIGYVVSDPTISGADADEASEVQRKAKAIFRAANTQLFSQEIPSPKGSLVVDGTDVLNPADAAVIAYIAKMLNTGVTPGIGPVSSLDSGLTEITGPIRKSHRRTKETP